MRLGAYPCHLTSGSVAARLYETDVISERHRHRYEVNNEYRKQLINAGMTISGVSPDYRLVEIIELPPSTHPYFIATQFHPEFKSRPNRAHPLFAGLVAAALEAEARTALRPANSGATAPDGERRGGRMSLPSTLRSLFFPDSAWESRRWTWSGTIQYAAAHRAVPGTAHLDLADALTRYGSLARADSYRLRRRLRGRRLSGRPADALAGSRRVVRAPRCRLGETRPAGDDPVVLGNRGRLGDSASGPGAARVGVPGLPRLGQGHRPHRRQRQRQDHPPLPRGHRGLCPVRPRRAAAGVGRADAVPARLAAGGVGADGPALRQNQRGQRRQKRRDAQVFHQRPPLVLPASGR